MVGFPGTWCFWVCLCLFLLMLVSVAICYLCFMNCDVCASCGFV